MNHHSISIESTAEWNTKFDRKLSQLGRNELESTVRDHIVFVLWQVPRGTRIELFDAYFSYLQRCCLNFCDENDLWLSAVLDLISYLRSNLEVPRHRLFDNFHSMGNATRAWYADLETVEGIKPSAYLVLDFCVLIWFTVDVNRQRLADLGDQQSKIWPGDLSLKDMLRGIGFKEQPAGNDQTAPWTDSLNLLNLRRIGCYKIVWVENLRDHLLMNISPPQIYIYHHVTVLRFIQLSQIGFVLGDGFVEETLQTIALLLPKYNLASSKWFINERKRARQFGGFLDIDARNQDLTSRGRQMECYRHWGERMSLIRHAFDQTEPNTLSQWWYDTRHAEKRINFWLGVGGISLALLFGLIQSVTGVWQVVLAYKK